MTVHNSDSLTLILLLMTCDLTGQHFFSLCWRLSSAVMFLDHEFQNVLKLGKLFITNCMVLQLQNDLDDADRTLLIICSAMHKTKLLFFFLVQTEQGDIFKVLFKISSLLLTHYFRCS